MPGNDTRSVKPPFSTGNGSTRRDFLRRAGIAGALLLTPSGLLAACGASSNNPTSGGSGGSSTGSTAGGGSASQGESTGQTQGGGKLKPTTLAMVGVSQPSPGRGLTKLLDQFQKQHPGVQVKYQYFSSEQFVALFTAAEQSGQEIDVMQLNGQDIRRYATNGSLMRMDDVPYKSRFQELALKTYTINGHLWGVPFGTTGGFTIMVNRYLLKKVGASYPKTYDELLDVAQKLKKQGVGAFTHPGKVIYLWPVWFFTTYAQVTKNKSEEKTMDTLRGNGKFTDPEVVEGLDAVFRFATDKLFTEDVLSLDTNGSEREFITGKAAFSLGDYGVSSTVRSQKVPNMDLWAETLPLVVSDKSVKSQFPGGPGAPLVIYHKAPKEKMAASKALIDYLTTDESDKYIVRDSQATLGVNNGVRGSNSALAVQEGKLLPNMTVYLDWFWPPEVTQAFQQGIQAGVAGNKNAKEVASDIQSVFEGLQKKGYKFQG